MSLKEELGLRHDFDSRGHEALLNVALTGTLLEKEGDRILRPLGLTDAQFNVLMLLKYQSNGSEMNQTTLGNMLLVNRSNVTGLVDRLEQLGWVRRTPEPSDRRVKLVSLTESGREILERAESEYNTRVHEVMSALTDDEHGLISSLLERLRKRLKETL